LLERLVEVGTSGVRVRRLGGCRAGEIRLSRFLHNARVRVSAMIASAFARTAQAAAGRPVLALQDTTTLRDDGAGTSLLLHPTLAVDAETGTLLGLVHSQSLRRSGGARGARKATPFAAKQSARWLAGTQAAAGLLQAGAARVTVVSDREGDIYEEFALRPPAVDLLVRVAQDRTLAGGGRLFAAAREWPELGRVTVSLPAAPGRAARQTQFAVRAGRVELRRPPRPAAEAQALPDQVAMVLVEAQEITPAAGQPAALWRLLTSHAVGTLAEAQQILMMYRARWTIEQLFRVCKSQGFDLEAVTMADAAAFERLAVATVIAAVQVLQLTRERDGAAGRPLADVFEAADQPALEAACAQLEGKTARQKNPHPKGSLAYAAWVCARLGGWTGYYGKPGPIVMLNGYRRFQDLKVGWTLARLL
jgi:hypothetical protein